MSSAKVAIPAVSRELEFIGNHLDEAEDIYDEAFEVDASLKELSDSVYDRAEEDALKLLGYLKADLSHGVQGLVRVDWIKARDSGWAVWGPIFMARGRKRRIGFVGLCFAFGKFGFRLIGWVFPRGAGRTVTVRAHLSKRHSQR
jgi:hypothetical protein